MKFVLSMITLLSCLMFLAACMGPSSIEMKQHFQFSEELRLIMRRIDQLVHERELTDQQVEEVRQRQVDRLAVAVTKLIGATETLIENPSGAGLDKSEITQFSRLTGQLSDEVKNIREASKTGNANGLSQALQRLNAVCNACHEKYRPG